MSETLALAIAGQEIGRLATFADEAVCRIMRQLDEDSMRPRAMNSPQSGDGPIESKIQAISSASASA